MISRISKSPKAESDLIAIWLHVATESPNAADGLLDRFEAKLALLADHPHMGAAREDIAPGMRYLVVGRYLLLYLIITHGIELVRVVHGAMHLKDLDL